jgi:DNA-damage-inducible protein J
MSTSANLSIRVEQDVKEDAERVLSQLGIPMSNAVGMFLRQVVLRRGLPFEVVLPALKPLDISMLTEEELDAELEKGYADMLSGNVVPAKEAFASIRKELGI